MEKINRLLDTTEEDIINDTPTQGEDKMKHREKGYKKQTTTKNNSKNRASVTFGTVDSSLIFF